MHLLITMTPLLDLMHPTVTVCLRLSNVRCTWHRLIMSCDQVSFSCLSPPNSQQAKTRPSYHIELRIENWSNLKPLASERLYDADWKDWCWSWNSNTLATSCKELSHWKRPWCWEWLGAGGEGDDRGWDGWMASPTQWTWVWVSSGSWWWTGRPGMLRFMGSQTVGHDWAIELNWTGMLLGSQDLTFSTRDLNLCHRLWRLSTMMSSVLPSKGQVYHIAGEGTSWAS